jgi:hypothetical protein
MKDRRFILADLDALYRDIQEKERELDDLMRRASALEEMTERELKRDAAFDQAKVERENG